MKQVLLFIVLYGIKKKEKKKKESSKKVFVYDKPTAPGEKKGNTHVVE